MFGDKNKFKNLKIDNDLTEKLIDVNEIEIEKYLSEKNNEILDLINRYKRVLLNSNPATGKTTFFANLCMKHSAKGSNGRIIFCAPYLIIQEQFKARLKSQKILIDLELNHKSKRKNLEVSDKIITSTFKSIYLIAESFNSNDLIIIDEAHALLNYYYTYGNTKQKDFYTEIVKVLYNTPAKLILMSGTPHVGLKTFLNLKEIKIKSNPLKSKINIEFSKHKKSNIVLNFAQASIKKYGDTSLNIIFIKNKRKCYVFKDLIEKNLKLNTEVLTSEDKDTPLYRELINHSTINKNIQILITTNVISTGANILNDNIGAAMMLDEYNPTEIKQFSKRFRNKLDIKIDVFNSLSNTKNKNVLEEVLNKRNNQLGVIKKIINELEVTYKNSNNLLNYDNSFYDSYDGSIQQLKDKLIERYLIQEVYFEKKINEFNKEPKRLIQLLNSYDDVMTIEVKSNYVVELDIDKNEVNDNINNELNQLFDDFIKDSETYLCALYHLLSKKFKYHSFKFECLFDSFDYSSKNPNPIITKQLNKFYVENELIIPLLELKSYIKDIKKLLYFIKTTKKNKRQPLIISIYFNKKFKELFYLQQSAFDREIPDEITIDDINVFSTEDIGLDTIWLKPPKLVNRNTGNSNSNHEELLIKKLLFHTFNYLNKNDAVNYDDFKAYLLSKNIKTNSKFIGKLEFPFNLVDFNKSNGNIKNFKQSFIIGLVRSIYVLDSKQTYSKSNTGRKSCYKLSDKVPDYEEIKKTSPLRAKEVNAAFLSVNYYRYTTYKHNYINLNISTRILANENSIFYDVLDDDYFNIIKQSNKL